MTSYSAARLSLYSLIFALFNVTVGAIPAYAAIEAFSFVEFNIAFVLGLSLPILLMVFIVTPRPAIKKRLPLLLTLAVLGLLYSLNNPQEKSFYLSLAFSCFVIQITSYWASEYNNFAQKTYVNGWIKNSIFVFSYAVFIIMFFTESLSSQWAWLAFSGLQILTAMSFILLQKNRNNEGFFRAIALLIINVIFAVGVYLWLTQQVNANTLVVLSIVTFLLAIANGCWQIVTTLITRESHYHEGGYAAPIPVSYDPATNLPNYQYALTYFQRSVATQVNARYAVIVFKPTNFQQVNGVLGHHNSDILLLQLAYCLQKSVENNAALLNFSEHDSPVRLARLQGLHFMVAMDVSQSKHDDNIIIEQLCKELSLAVPGPLSFKSFSSYFKLAFGVAFVGHDNENVSEVIACAEDALLQADQQHKLVSFFNQELAIFNQQQLNKMEQLKEAIEQDKLDWQLQPQIQLVTKAIMGFELQVSWQREGDELLNLADIMVIAEQSGDAYALSRQLIRQAYSTLTTLKKLNALTQVAIKLTDSSLLEPDIVDFIELQAKQHDIDFQYLAIEVSEAILLMSSPQAKASIDQLKSLGIQISIDEFSGSYQALRYIRRMAVSGIKIDCASLAKATAGSSDKAIINALVTLTRKMELPLIGSNINDQVTQEVFVAMGGQYGQGKRFSKGISHDELPHWLTAWQTQYPEQS